MNNCTLNVLPGVIDNDNLKFFDSLEVDVLQPGASETTIVNRGIAVYAYEANKLQLQCIGGTFNDSSGTSLGDTILIDDANEKHNIFFSQYATKVQIKNRKYLRRFFSYVSGCYTIIDVKDLQYCTNLVELALSGNPQSGSWADIAKCSSLARIYLNETMVEGNISALAQNTNIILLSLFSSNKITGDFSSWAQYRTAGTVKVQLYPSLQRNLLYCNGIDLTTLNARDIILTFDGLGGVSMAAEQNP